MKQLLTHLAVAALVLMAASDHASAVPTTNLLTNGSFESFGNGVFTGWTNGGNSGITPTQYAVQQPTNGSTPGQYGDVVSPDPFTYSPTPSGTNAAYFVADQADITLSQTVQLAVGKTYQIGFDLFENYSGASNPGAFTVTGSIAGATSLLPVATASSSSLTPGVWTHVAANFVATTASPTFALEFVSGTSPAADVLIDGVYITTVPEPASLALFGLGLLGLWSIRRVSAGQPARRSSPR